MCAFFFVFTNKFFFSILWNAGNLDNNKAVESYSIKRKKKKKKFCNIKPKYKVETVEWNRGGIIQTKAILWPFFFFSFQRLKFFCYVILNSGPSHFLISSPCFIIIIVIGTVFIYLFLRRFTSEDTITTDPKTVFEKNNF